MTHDGVSTATQQLSHRIRQLLAERSGLYFKDHNLRNLETALDIRMKVCGVASLPAYYSRLSDSASREDELRELLNLLTVNHTYFFRNQPHFSALQHRVLPDCLRHKARDTAGARGKRPPLRIWSAGCSTGEEPYSIAIALRESSPFLAEREVVIMATDASMKALEKARQGVYSPRALEHLSPRLREKYFHAFVKDGKTVFQLHDDVRRIVQFGYFNLMSADYPADFDIVFCRNVTIYFELPTVIEVMRRIHDSLVPGGYLFIGYSESLPFMREQFQMETWQDALFYRPLDASVAPPAREDVPHLVDILADVSRVEMQAGADTSPAQATDPATEALLAEAAALSRLKKYDAAISLIREVQQQNPAAIQTYYLIAEILVNQGRFDEALRELDGLSRKDALFAPAHYLRGCIAVERERWDDAERSLRRALFIDPDFALAYFYLAQVCKSRGQPEEAVRQYRNTLKAVGGEAPEAVLPHAGGINAATLLSVCRDNLERLKASS